MGEIIDLVAKGGIAGIDLAAILILCKSTKYYLTHVPDDRKYAFVPKKGINAFVRGETVRLRSLGKGLLIITPIVIVISVAIVAAVIVLIGIYGPKT